MKVRDLMERLEELDPDEKVVVFDRSGVIEHTCPVLDVEPDPRDGVLLVVEVAEGEGLDG